jgi:hypothetical protein
MTDARGARIVRLIEDPAVDGDLLLVGIGLAARYDFSLDCGSSISGLGKLLWSTRDMSEYKVRNAFRSDMRGYKPPPLEGTCCAPMIRRTTHCGQRATMRGYITDWATGVKTALAGCSRHQEWFRAASDRNNRAKLDNPPLPVANHGGELARHFPAIDWPRFWAKLDPKWVQHPEVKPWPKPTLTLILGEGA